MGQGFAGIVADLGTTGAVASLFRQPLPTCRPVRLGLALVSHPVHDVPQPSVADVHCSIPQHLDEPPGLARPAGIGSELVTDAQSHYRPGRDSMVLMGSILRFLPYTA